MGVNGTLQLAGFFCSFLAVILNIMACADRQWRKNDPGKEIIETLIRSTGLWERCTFQATGHYQCDDYDNYFIGLPALLAVARVFTCLAITFGIIATLIAIGGLECTKIADTEEEKPTKAKMIVVSGFMTVFAAILMCIGVSWFAANVYQNYFQLNRIIGNNQNGQNFNLEGNERYIYGRALFVGWVSSLIGMIGGVLSICSSWGGMSGDEEDNYDNYNTGYQPPTNRNDKSEYL